MTKSLKLTTPLLCHPLQKLNPIINNAPCAWTHYSKKKTHRKPVIVAEPAPDIVIKPIKKKDHEAIYKLMSCSFFPHETIFQTLKLAPSPLMRTMMMDHMADNMSFMAINKNDQKHVGACINIEMKECSYLKYDQWAKQTKHVNVQKYFNFLSYVHRVAFIFQEFNLESLFEIKYYFVLPKFRRMGIAEQLVKVSTARGIKDYSFIRCDSTGNIASDLMDKLKFTQIVKVPYCSYTGADGLPHFVPPAPNYAVRIYGYGHPKLKEMEN